VLESNFYAYRATGDVKYQQRAQAALASFNRVLKVNNAYAGINNVNSRSGGGFIDDTESFFFAEVLKYLFLTFDDPERISLDKCKYPISHYYSVP
jgi:mannosyl-oligosaccharide alpha-1,2-mannosidase